MPRKKQVITLNCRISTDMYFESRPPASRPHLRKVSSVYDTSDDGSKTYVLCHYVEQVVKMEMQLLNVLKSQRDVIPT